ncbi:nitric oxide synthase oxygenase [Paenibacillus sp. UNC451MF]|uniref:nitric oxide synthase oxygenase n=1 Tax=Paenibacillus sp. UNC451MF TaxID=1449063 RepID=UPI0007E8EC76|nr:nitric oxide synthase oxygenase [Paenibacillus sp. UNC451MF]
MNNKQLDEAISFIRASYTENGKQPEETERRIQEVTASINQTGTYSHTIDELRFGAKWAWRNNSRCIGRLFWSSLEIFDHRDLLTEDSIAQSLFEHIEFATNGGRIRPAITLFAPETDKQTIRIWNHQLIRYAGYETDKGIIGDPASVAFTKQCLRLGWQGKRTPFDILPLVIQIGMSEPRWYPIPPELILEVPLTHPTIERFAELGLRWYAVPCISDMRLEIGGLSYTAAPFNGWYMGTEIGARNFSDTSRYNQLPLIADLMGLDRSTNSSLWKDRALVELNAAVLHSYKSNGVSIVDHHTASEQFMRFEKQELDAGRKVNGKWSWLIPPMSPTATPIWDHYFTEIEMKPSFSYQPVPYASDEAQVDHKNTSAIVTAAAHGCPFHR